MAKKTKKAATGELIISKSRTKAAAKKSNVSSDFYGALDATVRNLIAKALGLSQSDVQVVAPYVGGGFGCKAGVSMEALAVAIATRLKGRPIKLRLTREEEFYTAFVRQGLVGYFKMGCDANGKLLAMENRFYWDGGAYTEYGVNITRASGYSSTGPYEVPNVKTDSYCVYTNHPVGGPMRGFGMPEMHAGLEQCIDELALAIGMDAVEFRKLNCVKDGDIIREINITNIGPDRTRELKSSIRWTLEKMYDKMKATP